MKNKYAPMISRRALLKWSTPAIAVIALPAHASTSGMPGLIVIKEQTGGPNPATTKTDVIEYTITLENTGDCDLTNVNVVDTLPDGTEGVLSAVSESIDSDGVLQIGEIWEYTISYNVTLEDLIAGEDLVNTVTVSVDELPDDVVDEEETPVTQVCACSGAPVLSVLAPPKCSGTPPVGTAVIEITAADECGAIIKSIEIETDDPKSDVGSLPDLPVTVTDVDAVTVTWLGPASDGVTCLPLATIIVTIEYCCVGDPDTVLIETYDITQLLIDSNAG